MSKYPEHDKLRQISAHSQKIGEFINEYLPQLRITLAEWATPNRLVPVQRRMECLIADFFNIDLDKISEEKSAMLAELRKGEGDEGSGL